MKNEYEKAGEFLETAIDFINFAIYRIERTKKTKFSLALLNGGDEEHLFEVVPNEDMIERNPKVLALAAGMTAKMLNYYHAGRGVSLFWSCHYGDTFLFSVDHNPGTEDWEFVSTEDLSYSVQKVKWKPE